MQERRSTALGWLETAVLDQLWTHGSADVAAMHARVGEPRGLARNTIQSTLERLYRKGIAERRKCGRAFEYHARISRGEWLTSSLGGVLENLPGADAALVLSAFVDLAERAGAQSLDALEELVRQRRREREGES